jgi:hypothetical protein
MKLCRQHEEKITLGIRSRRIMCKNFSRRKLFFNLPNARSILERSEFSVRLKSLRDCKFRINTFIGLLVHF